MNEGRTQSHRRQSPLLSLGFAVFVFLLTYDGALRKWLFTANEQLVFVIKDAVLALLVAAALKARHASAARLLPSYVRAWLLLYAAWVLFGLFNPSSPGLLIGLWGLKAHLLYAGLILVLPCVFRSVHEAIGTLERTYALIVIPVSVLALVQVGLGADSSLNQHVRGGLEGLSYFGEQSLVRVAGPFSYITGMAAFVQVMSLLGVSLYVAGCRSWTFLAGLAFIAAALPVTGSRGVLYACIVGALAIITAARWASLVSGRSMFYTFLVLAAVSGGSYIWQNDAWIALQERTIENAAEGIPRAVMAFTNAFDHMDAAGFAGFGTGTANFGAVALSAQVEPFSWFPAGTGFEEESGRVVLELGIVGWTLSLAVRLSFFVLALSLLLTGGSRESRTAAVVAFPFVLFGLYAGSGVFAASYMAVAYWFAAGLLAVAQRDQFRKRLAARAQFSMRAA